MAVFVSQSIVLLITFYITLEASIVSHLNDGMDEEETLDFQEIEFHDFIRKHVVSIMFLHIFGISNLDYVVLYRFVCSFSLLFMESASK